MSIQHNSSEEMIEHQKRLGKEILHFENMAFLLLFPAYFVTFFPENKQTNNCIGLPSQLE